MKELDSFLQAIREGELIPWASQVKATEQFGVSLAQVEDAALAVGILPPATSVTATPSPRRSTPALSQPGRSAGLWWSGRVCY